MIGDGRPAFLVAEAGVNHNGVLKNALRMVRVAIQAGADAVKFQTFRPEELTTATAPLADYQRQGVRSANTQLDLLRGLVLTEEDHLQIQAECQRAGIVFLSTPFDDPSAEFLHRLNVPAFKVSSGDLTNLPFLVKLARYRKPMFISTGMSRFAEVARAVAVCRDAGNSRLVLLQCTSSYPAPEGEANVRVVSTYRSKLGVLAGYSDHTRSIAPAVAARALGACVIEKHFTLDRHLPGPDHKASLEPQELREFVDAIRTAESALGDGRKRVMPSEMSNVALVRKSVVARVRIPRGTRITAFHLAVRRPGTGAPPEDLAALIGRTARIDIEKDSPIGWDLVR